MNQSQVMAMQLQKRDPVAWTALLRECLDVEDIVVTAVSATPLRYPSQQSKLTRYQISIADQQDPITLISKQSNTPEINFYTHIATQFPHIAPRCWFIHPAQGKRKGWLLLDDVPNNVPPDKWAIDDLTHVIDKMAELHSTFWQQQETLQPFGFVPVFQPHKRYTVAQLKAENASYFEEGPAAILSEHAITASANLAPQLLKAANGLAVMRALGGWPGILGETHLAIAADLLDDPLPMIEPLRRLPQTLLHGSPHSYHWMITLFDDLRLLDWQKTAVGPSIYDLVNFLEQFDVLYADETQAETHIRQTWPLSEETIVDSYILGMKRRLRSQFNGRIHRNAIPAARCLYTLTNWFAFFAEWADDMPDKYAWQKINRLPTEEVVGTMYEPFIRYRPYLSATFQRFLRAYRSL